MIRRSLPSWLALGSDDVILSLDKPAPPVLLREIKRVAGVSSRADSVRTIETPREAGWAFHQAHVRRAGFREAAHDAVLTGDIDLIVRPGVRRLPELVGKNRVGLVSSARVPAPLRPSQALRACAFVLKQRLAPPKFSGLYAFWRPWWLETEDQGIRRLRTPTEAVYSSAGPGIVGEDTYLYICMKRAYKCLFSNQIGAIGLSRNVEDLPREQFSWGRYMAGLGYNSAIGVATSIGFAYPYFLKGYLYQRSSSHEFIDPYGPGFHL